MPPKKDRPMASKRGQAAATPQAFSDDEVLEAHFRLELSNDGGEPGRKMFLRTYRLAEDDQRVWHATPETDWPLLATIYSDRIVMRPMHTVPHAQRYLSPKNGRFVTVTYIDRSSSDLPNDAKNAAWEIERRLDSDIFDSPQRGLGLTKDLDPLWQKLSRIPDTYGLVFTANSEMHAKEGTISLRVQEVDKLRRRFNRITANGRRLIREARLSAVYDDLLTRLDPERFQPIVRVSPPLVQVRRASAKQATAGERAQRRSNLEAVRKQIGQTAQEAPHELMMLHAEIERATLARMIEDFKEKLKSGLTEPHWQTFFERNQFVLSVAFARPVKLTHTQFHAKGSTLAGTGAQIGDFLFKELGQALAIVEIKTPETALLQGRPYRGQEVFGPTSELSGAVTQVLYQQSELRQRWFMHERDTPSLKQSGADVIKCVVVAGRMPKEPIKLRSFEVFRNACKDVDIVTFDELLEKLEFLEKQLTPEPDPVPF
jgi:hypothetical protein